LINNPNRNATTAEKMRDFIVPVTGEFAPDAFYGLGPLDIDRFNSERLILLADWDSKRILITIVQGAYGPPRIQKGLDESFELKYLIPESMSEFDFICGTDQGRDQYGEHVSEDKFDAKYQEYILKVAMAADKVFESVPKNVDVSDDIKSQIRAILEPYRSEYY
jgi:hypothetical protein